MIRQLAHGMLLAAMWLSTCMWTQNIFASPDLSINKPAEILITIVGDKNDKSAISLYETAKIFSPKTTVVKWQSHTSQADDKYPVLDKPAAYICIEFRCSLPAFTPENLKQMLAIVLPKNSELSAMQTVMDSNAIGENNFNDLLKTKSIWAIVPLFWFFGLLLSISPCLLPLMLIITSIIGGSAGSITKSKAITLSLTYILALSVTYTVAGIAAASFGLYLQGMMQNNWVIGTFSAIFILLAISLFGFINFQLPYKWRNSISVYSQSHAAGSYVGVAIMGMLATLIASPCIAAPLAGILAYITESGNIQLGAIALFSTGLGIGTPVILVITIGMDLLQKLGGWQKYIKQFFGILLLGIAIWLLSRIITPKATMLLWSGLTIFTAMVMGVLDTRPLQLHDNYHHVNKELARLLFSIKKTIGIMLLIFGGAILIGALTGNINPLSPISNKSFLSSPPVESTELDFIKIKSLPELMTMSSKSNSPPHKPVLIMFTAAWCSACQHIEKAVFTNESIKYQLREFSLLKVDLTNNDTNAAEITKHFSIIGPPVILFYFNGDLLNQRVDGDISPDMFSTLIKAIETEINNRKGGQHEPR